MLSKHSKMTLGEAGLTEGDKLLQVLLEWYFDDMVLTSPNTLGIEQSTYLDRLISIRVDHGRDFWASRLLGPSW